MTLKEEVKEIISNHSDGYDNKEIGFINDLRQGGCVSGLVGELIYHGDTGAFFERHKEAINALLCETLEIIGLDSISEVLKDFDNSDPLAMDTNNQNLLAWFAFEETAYRMYPED